MRKTDKKLDNQIRLALTDVCETALKKIDGFQWLTHTVNYSSFPESLMVTCVFESNEHLEVYLASDSNTQLAKLIHNEFKDLGIKIQSIQRHIAFDTEENCAKQNDGNWARRLH